MTAQTISAQGGGGVRERLDRWFPERQLILRQRDGIVAVRLGRRAQLLAALIVALGGCVLVAGAGISMQKLIASPRQDRFLPMSDVEAPLDRLAAMIGETAPKATVQADPPLSDLAGGTDPQAEASARRAAMLDDRNRVLEENASVAADRMRELEHALVEARQQLDAAQAAQRVTEQDRDKRAADAVAAERRLQAASAEHERALIRLTQETRRSISEVERIINATGVDPNRLLPAADGRSPARGGPFVPWTDRHREAAGPSSQTAAGIGLDIERLDRLAKLLRTLPLAAPLGEFTLASPFGRRIDPFNGEAEMHEGIDLQAPLGTPVTATAPGRVVFAGRNSSYGLVVEIDHGHDIHTRYAHLDRIAVGQGEVVGFRQKIGLLGRTGRTSGPHLHYEVLVDGQPNDPVYFLKATSHVRKIQ